jgi:hypothetical protein
MRKCPSCGDAIYSEDGKSPMCFRCRQSGVKVRLEIYDKEDIKDEPLKGISEIYFGNINFKKMRKKNIEYGGFQG